MIERMVFQKLSPGLHTCALAHTYVPQINACKIYSVLREAPSLFMLIIAFIIHMHLKLINNLENLSFIFLKCCLNDIMPKPFPYFSK